MTVIKLIVRSLVHYRWKNIPVILGIALSSAVLTGALLVGDSVSKNLFRITDFRLGKVEYALNTADRFVGSGLASRLGQALNSDVAAVLLTEGIAVGDGGQTRVNDVQIIGVGDMFDQTLGIESLYNELADDEIIINNALAIRLNLKSGDQVLLRIRKSSVIPMNAPFVSDEDQVVAARFTIKTIAQNEHIGRFNLRISQTSPYNAFIALSQLNELMEIQEKANLLLFSSSEPLQKDKLFSAVQKYWTTDDMGLVLRETPDSGELEVISERVFLDEPVIQAIQSFSIAPEFILSYFVNSIINVSEENRNIGAELVNASNPSDFTKKTQETVYSFISTLPSLTDHEISVNTWLAEDLKIRVGDTLKVGYYRSGTLRRLLEMEHAFIVKQIVPIQGKFADRSLMPEIPGLSDVDNCRDWDTGIPIDLAKIRDKDEKYWNDYKGTPKAFISLPMARGLWENMYGSYTAARFPKDLINHENLRSHLADQISPFSLGFQLTAVREQGMSAAGQGVDFSELFLGLSFFVILAAFILTVLLLVLNLEGRRKQFRTLTSVGIPRKTIHLIMFSEGFVLSALGSLIGSGLAIFYTSLVFSALNGVWSDIVQTDMMQLIVSIPVLTVGFLLSMVISWLTISLTARNFLKAPVAKAEKKFSWNTSQWILFTAMASGVVSITLLVKELLSSADLNPTIFFASGALILISFLSGMYYFLIRAERKEFIQLDIFTLSIKNGLRHKSRTLSIVSLLAIGTFIVFSTGSNRKDVLLDTSSKASGLGGFQYFSETTVPVNRDLNDSKVRREIGLSDDFHFVQFSKAPGDDASCLNLNRISNPVILGVDPASLEGRFSFATRTEFLSASTPWSSLDNILLPGLIPAIADQTVIKWGLGMKVGDTLVYNDASGKELKLLLIGGLANSVFQGNVIISAKNFEDAFPSHTGSGVFLIESTNPIETKSSEQLNNLFRDFGWEMTSTSYRLARFNSIENTYLSIFLLMGALAILIATIGLSIVLAKSILERKNELALLSAHGIGKKNILKLIMNEYILLLVAGLIMGSVAAALATLPSLLSPNAEVSFVLLISIISILLLNGIFWIRIMAGYYLKNHRNYIALREE
jgi:putative ABC transport system permease protein